MSNNQITKFIWNNQWLRAENINPEWQKLGNNSKVGFTKRDYKCINTGPAPLVLFSDRVKEMVLNSPSVKILKKL